eukprot:CAMPEP_0194392852 /NCGR_PEP_ID=MMETSP0174-20130528/122970_1 /TAXON_ID=216777 /ORGANISM="Proboscia alata, Strain PI-D3" /LENGTH=117 /DNA_ID=CAMNT_0039188467 /DNA_START=1710 /DNA_END=2063 /DNA_ORIENTATION=-
MWKSILVTTTTSKQPPVRTTAKGKIPTVSFATTNRSPHSGTVGGGDDVKAAILAMAMMAHATTNRSPHSGTVGGGDDVKAAVLAMAMMAQATETRLKYSMEKQLSMMERRFTLRLIN